MTPVVTELAAHLAPEALERSPFGRIAVEAIAVAAGIKPAARFTASLSEAGDFCKVLADAGMELEEYVPEPGEWGYRYATRAEREAFTASHVRVYYAVTRQDLGRVIDAQRARDDEALGKTLGYPDCCIATNLLLGNLSMTDMVRVARTGGTRNWRLNIFLTEMDGARGAQYYLISHFPCSLRCQPSIAYAEAVYKVLREVAPGFAQALEDHLSLPVLLRDERTPLEARRYGNFGCLLHGVTIDNMVLYHHWQSFRSCDDLADAGLDRADCLARDGLDINVIRTETGKILGRLGGDRWQLVTF
jgi:hypothetical protein